MEISIINGAACGTCQDGGMIAEEIGFSCEARDQGASYRAKITVVFVCDQCHQRDTETFTGEWGKLVDALRDVKSCQKQLGM